MRRGEEAKPLLPDLHRIATESDGGDAYLAMIAAMTIEDSRVYVRELVEASLARKKGAPYRCLRKFDPRLAGALIEGFREERRSRDQGAGADFTERLRAAIDLLVQGSPRAVPFLGERLAESGEGEFPGWLRIVRRIRPVPQELGEVLVKITLSGSDAARAEILRMCTDKESDLLEIRNGLAPALAARLEAAHLEDVDGILSALGRLRVGGERIVRSVMAAGGRSPELQRRAIQTLGQLGEAASSAVVSLVEIAREQPEARVVVLEALVAIGSRDSLPYLTEVLDEGTTAEKIAVVKRLTNVPGCESAIPRLARMVRDESGGLSARSIRALVAIDPRLQTRSGTEAMQYLLTGATPGKRERGARMVRELDDMPAEVAQAFLALVDDDVPSVRAAALRALKLGGPFEPHKALFVARMVDLATSGHPTQPRVLADRPAKWRSVALRLIGKLGLSDPAGRQVLVRALRCPDSNSQETALHALMHLPSPTVEEYLEVRECLRRSEGSVRVLARFVLQQPPWRAVRPPSTVR